jgi:hypothetical protein
VAAAQHKKQQFNVQLPRSLIAFLTGTLRIIFFCADSASQGNVMASIDGDMSAQAMESVRLDLFSALTCFPMIFCWNTACRFNNGYLVLPHGGASTCGVNGEYEM